MAGFSREIYYFNFKYYLIKRGGGEPNPEWLKEGKGVLVTRTFKGQVDVRINLKNIKIKFFIYKKRHFSAIQNYFDNLFCFKKETCPLAAVKQNYILKIFGRILVF